MRIIQVSDEIAPGDAIGNHELALDEMFKKNGIDSYIYANSVHSKLTDLVLKYTNYEEREDDVILYHLGMGKDLNREIANHKCRIILNYHNIMPPQYFCGYNDKLVLLAKKGYEDIKYLSAKVDGVIADSVYNANQLKNIDYGCSIETIPILIHFDDYNIAPNEELISKYKADNAKNIIFVGRIAPNKKYEDVILDFYYYTKYFNKNSSLILIGSFNNFELYYLKLKKYVKRLGLDNVIFIGHISFRDIVSFYHIADAFICESEHEGFGLPVVESMQAGTVVVVADNSSLSELVEMDELKFNTLNAADFTYKIEQLLLNESLYENMKEYCSNRGSSFPGAMLQSHICQL